MSVCLSLVLTWFPARSCSPFALQMRLAGKESNCNAEPMGYWLLLMLKSSVFHGLYNWTQRQRVGTVKNPDLLMKPVDIPCCFRDTNGKSATTAMANASGGPRTDPIISEWFGFAQSLVYNFRSLPMD